MGGQQAKELWVIYPDYTTSTSSNVTEPVLVPSSSADTDYTIFDESGAWGLSGYIATQQDDCSAWVEDRDSNSHRFCLVTSGSGVLKCPESPFELTHEFTKAPYWMSEIMHLCPFEGSGGSYLTDGRHQNGGQTAMEQWMISPKRLSSKASNAIELV